MPESVWECHSNPGRRQRDSETTVLRWFGDGAVKKPWVCHAAACLGNTIVAAQAAGELSRIVILSYHDDGELRRPCFTTKVVLDSLDAIDSPSIISNDESAWACWRPRGADEWRVASVNGGSLAALPLSCVAFGAPFEAERDDSSLRARRALLGGSGLAALVNDGGVLGVAADAPQQPSAHKKRSTNADWSKLVQALDVENENVDALEALGSAARAYDAPSQELGRAAVDASTRLLEKTPLHGFGADDVDASATLALRFVEQRERRHAHLIEALSGAARCLDADSASQLADAHGRSACAAAAARVHAKLLLRKHRAGQLLSRACGDEVSEDAAFDARRRAAGLGAVDALYGEAPNDSLRAARRSLRSCEDAASVKDVCALIRAAAAAGRDARNDAAKRLRLQVDGPFRDARESLRAALEALENDGFPRCDARAPPAELRRLALDLADLLVGSHAPVDRDGRDDATLAATCLVAAADAALRGKKGGTSQQRASQWASDAAPALAIAEASRAHAVFLDACLRADDVACGAEDSKPDGVASSRHAAAGRARIARRCASSSEFADEALCILGRRGLFGDVADLSHVCSTERVMSDGVHGLRWLCAADYASNADDLVTLASKSPSAACGTTLTSIASIASIAAGDRTRQLRCEAALKARKLAAVVSSDDAPCPDIVRAALDKVPTSSGDDRLALLETALDALALETRDTAKVWAAAFAADEQTWRSALGNDLVVPPDCKRTCFYDLAAKRAAASDQSWSDTPSLTAALAPRGDARAIARLLASAQEDAREGARADREAAAAARAASSDDAE